MATRNIQIGYEMVYVEGPTVSASRTPENTKDVCQRRADAGWTLRAMTYVPRGDEPYILCVFAKKY